MIGRGGDVRAQLWNVRVEEGGIFLRIPLVADRPPSSQLHRYVGNPRHEYIVLDPSDEAFAALAAEAQRDGGALPERARVDYLHALVYRTLGGLLDRAKLDACLAWCGAQANRAVPIGALIRMGAGACRHRAFLFFHLARRLGLGVELCRGAVPQGRHAWNVVRVDGRRVFVDTAFGLVIDDARAAEEAHGYVPSRHGAAARGRGPRAGRGRSRGRALPRLPLPPRAAQGAGGRGGGARALPRARRARGALPPPPPPRRRARRGDVRHGPLRLGPDLRRRRRRGAPPDGRDRPRRDGQAPPHVGG